jgi:hypothetical protein
MVVAEEIMAPASGMRPVRTGFEGMRAGERRGDMESTIRVMLHRSQQVQLKLYAYECDPA